MSNQEFSKCLLGVKAESLLVALALPQFDWNQLAIIDNVDKNEGPVSNPLSRKYLTYLDKNYWNIFLKLFAPKEINSINNFLCPLNIYIRLNKQVINLGRESWYDNIDIFFKKNIFSINNQTWNAFKKLEKNQVNDLFTSFFSFYADLSFHDSINFEVFYKLWDEQKSDLVTFMNLFIQDWLKFFKTQEGIKFWRLIPSLYKMSIQPTPTELGVAEFVFNIIQPHYFFDEELFNETSKKFLDKNETNFTKASFDSLIEEDKKILHVINQNKKTLRSEKFWAFPELNLKPESNTLVHWAWKYKHTLNEEKKVIIDINDFIIDQHYFCATILLIDSQYEVRFLQNNQTFFDNQLIHKLKDHFEHSIQFDDFWFHWHFLEKTLSANDFGGPYLDSTIHYSDSSNHVEHINWSQNFAAKDGLANLKSLELINAHQSYWQHYLYQITRILWSDLYSASF
jgi:hypothetical protein